MSRTQSKCREKTVYCHAYTFKGEKVALSITSNHSHGSITVSATGKKVFEGTINELLVWVAARQTWRQALTHAFTTRKITEKVYDNELARLMAREEDARIAYGIARENAPE